jgi:hypothetical protein
LTKKSIEVILVEHENAQVLKRFLPLMDPDQSEIRELLMVPSLHQWCYQSDRRQTLNYKANVRAFLGRYVIGRSVNNEDYMKSWRDDVFELRVQLQRRDNTRIFGAFAKPDVFIAIHQKLRSEFRSQADWDRAIERVLHAWATLFPGYRPILSRPFSNYVTSNCIDVNL